MQNTAIEKTTTTANACSWCQRYRTKIQGSWSLHWKNVTALY